MAKTESKMIELGTLAPDFQLHDVITDDLIQFNDSGKYRATVVMFICNHCPYVKHINSELSRVANRYIPKGIRFIAINSNDVDNYPDDSPEYMVDTAHANNYPFPYLFDETQDVAKAYQATCTPDFFVFDQDSLLIYRGQFDDSRPGNNIPVTGSSMTHALDCALENIQVSTTQKPSLGCNIKWRQY